MGRPAVGGVRLSSCLLVITSSQPRIHPALTLYTYSLASTSFATHFIMPSLTLWSENQIRDIALSLHHVPTSPHRVKRPNSLLQPSPHAPAAAPPGATQSARLGSAAATVPSTALFLRARADAEAPAQMESRDVSSTRPPWISSERIACTCVGVGVSVWSRGQGEGRERRGREGGEKEGVTYLVKVEDQV